MDPELQNTPYRTRVRCLTGYAARVRTGYFGRGKQVQAGTVSRALTSIGQTIALAYNLNPTKAVTSDKFAPRLQQMMDSMRKDNPHTKKKLPVEVDVPEFLFKLGTGVGASE